MICKGKYVFYLGQIRSYSSQQSNEQIWEPFAAMTDGGPNYSYQLFCEQIRHLLNEGE